MARQRATPRSTGHRKPSLAGDDTELGRLTEIEHIVVLMLENRSFDHMLGYLSLEAGRTDIDGLGAGMKNRYRGRDYPVHHLGERGFTKNEDPAHDGASIAAQLSKQSGGFVANYAKERPKASDKGIVMGYYNGDDLPTYDHLAREYCVSDRWFSSVPGATWPNRLYAAAGKAAGSKNGKKLPIYDLPSFVRHLQRRKVSWRWYAHDISTLRLVDSKYRVGAFSHFSYFDRHSLRVRENFLDHARSGDLAAVSWIDPNFVDFNYYGPAGSNDDHPPSDVMAGQELVFKLYDAVVRSPAWPKTLLVITYDEHGGFYDHVTPPPAADDSPSFRSYGARVPAFIVSPWVERGSVSGSRTAMVFDHTSIIKTILTRFCRNAAGDIPDMGKRVAAAQSLAPLLTRVIPRRAEPSTGYSHLVDRFAAWHADLARQRLRQGVAPTASPDDLHELQREVIAAKRQLRAEGLPEGQP
jgi:phospholipase C